MIRVDESDPVGEIEPAFPYRDVTVRRVAFNTHYDLQSEIGRGKFGTVYHCKEKKSGLRLAAKIVNTTKKEDRRSVEREVEIMRRLQHPRLIQLYDAIDTGKQFYVILELIEGGELFERVIDDDFMLTERSCAVFMRQICEGIEFVHAQNILHLDLKPENILCLTKEGNRVKIIDFGLARQFDPKKKLQVLFGTPEFVAPEVVNFDQIGYGTDMWSIGVICYVLLSGLSPFMGDTDVETMANVTIAKYDFDHEAFTDISEDAKDFIRCLLIKDKEKRASAAQCQKHRWLARRSASVKIEEVKETKTKESAKKKKKKTEEKPKEKVPEPKTELDVTKDNLRLFVERWREHPNSPYMLDDTSDSSLETIRNVESMSLRGQSPSPPQSICSSLSEVSESPRNRSFLTIPSFGLERRASEGNSKESTNRDPAAQIMLAEEIIKLSEHLRSIAASSASPIEEEAKTKRVVEKIRSAEEPMPLETRKTVEEKVSASNFKENKSTREKNGDSLLKSRIVDRGQSSEEVNEISEKLSTITRQRKLNGTTFNGSRKYEKQESNSSTFTLRRSSSRLNEALMTRENTRNEEEDSRVTSTFSRTWRSEMRNDLEFGDTDIRMHREFGDTDMRMHREEIDLTPPWRKPRVKHRFSETCRDVPRISDLRDLHKSVDLDEPTSTKDLLLQLLGEWEERPGSARGRKSISVDWAENSIGRRTMNSLAEYFQSEQKKSTKTAVSASSAIYR